MLTYSAEEYKEYYGIFSKKIMENVCKITFFIRLTRTLICEILRTSKAQDYKTIGNNEYFRMRTNSNENEVFTRRI